MKNFLKNRIKNFLILLSILVFILPFDFVNATYIDEYYFQRGKFIQKNLDDVEITMMIDEDIKNHKLLQNIFNASENLYKTHIMNEIIKKSNNFIFYSNIEFNVRDFFIKWMNNPNNYEKYSTSFFDIYYLKNNSYKYKFYSNSRKHDSSYAPFNVDNIEVPIEKMADKIKFYAKNQFLYDFPWMKYFKNPDISLEDKKERLKTEILDVFAKIWINPRIIDVGDEFDVFIEFEDDSIIVLRSYVFIEPQLYKKLILPSKSVKVANKNQVTNEEKMKILQIIKKSNPDFNFEYDLNGIRVADYYIDDKFFNVSSFFNTFDWYSNFLNTSPKNIWQDFKKYWLYSFNPEDAIVCDNVNSLWFNKYWFNDVILNQEEIMVMTHAPDIMSIWYIGSYFNDGGTFHSRVVDCIDFSDMIYEEELENTENNNQNLDNSLNNSSENNQNWESSSENTENTNPENLDNTNIENNNQNSENYTENITNNSFTENNQNNSSSSSNSWHGWYTPWIPTISNNNFENLEISNILNSAPQNPQNSNIILSDKIENKTNIIFDLGENTENSNSNYILSTFADNWNIEIPENPISDNKNTENKNPKFIQNSKIILPDYLPATWFEIIFVLIFSILSSFLIFRKNLKN